MLSASHHACQLRRGVLSSDVIWIQSGRQTTYVHSLVLGLGQLARTVTICLVCPSHSPYHAGMLMCISSLHACCYHDMHHWLILSIHHLALTPCSRAQDDVTASKLECYNTREEAANHYWSAILFVTRKMTALGLDALFKGAPCLKTWRAATLVGYGGSVASSNLTSKVRLPACPMPACCE